MSVSTPILMVPSETWAWAVGAAMSATAARAGSQYWIMRFDPFIQLWVAGRARLYSEVVMELRGVAIELRVPDHVHHPSALHHVVAIGHRGGEAEILLDE